MLKEFKAFALKGNIFDLAVGVIIGGAFGKIVTSLVNDLIMPIMGLLIGGIDISKLQASISLRKGMDVTIKYGQFLQSVVDFLIISFSIFLFIKFITSFKKKEEKVEVIKVIEPTKEELLLEEIRDILKTLKEN
jgi:large conductance mechanosensitive channel